MVGPDRRRCGRRAPVSVWFAIAALCALVGVTWLGSLQAPFVFDDIPRIARADPAILQLWPPNGWLFGSQRPLVQCTLAANHALGGFDPMGYRIVNVCLHACAVITLYFVVLGSLRLLTKRGTTPIPTAWSGELAFAIAALWALHPIATSVTTYIIQRAELFAVLWTMLALLCVVHVQEATGWLRRALLATIPTCLALALLSKPTAVAAPFVVLLFDVFVGTGSWRATMRLRWPVHVANMLILVILFALGVADGVLGNRGNIAGYGLGVADTSPVEYLFLSLRACGLYTRMVVDPSVLAIDRGRDALTPLWTALVGWPVSCAAFILLAWAIVRRAWWGALVACVVVPLFPTTSFIPIADAAVDHRMYGPLAAIIAGVVLGGAWLFACLRERALCSSVQWRAIPILLFAALLLLELQATVRRQRDYGDPVQLWSLAIERSPRHARAYVNRAGLLLERADHQVAMDRDADLQRAAEDLRVAEELAPGRPVLLLNQAMLDLKLGNAARALERINTATVRTRADAPTLGARGDALRMLGRTDEAARSYALAQERAPTDPMYPFLEGNCRAVLGDAALAVRLYERALQYAVDPEFQASIHFNRGNALLALGQPKDAAQAYEAALRADASHQGAREWLKKVTDDGR